MFWGLGGQIRLHLYSQPTDMRKGFDGLGGLVRNELERDPLSGDAFIFINRRQNMLKLLVWDRSGFVIYYKRLESGTFEFPKNRGTGKSISIGREELVMILEGIKLETIKKRKRYLSRNFVNN